jgi:hypothetical protein
MHPGEVVLSVDYGAATTVAVLVGPDGAWELVRPDGTQQLASAVFLQADGSWLVGGRAWQAGALAPERFEFSPMRWIRQEHLVLGGVQVEPVDMIAATLRWVGGAAAAQLGGAPVGVRLVVPAQWGPRRRTALREAARRAGLGQPSLVEAPSAAAGRFVATGGGLLVGSFLVICDWGAGFTATVLRRSPYGFEVLSTVEALDAGGLALDQVLAGQLPALVAVGAGQKGSGQNGSGQDGSGQDGGGGVSVGLWSAARGAREALSQSAAVTVALPEGPPVVLTAAGVLPGFGPVVKRAADTIRAARRDRSTLPGWAFGVGFATRLAGVRAPRRGTQAQPG